MCAAAPAAHAEIDLASIEDVEALSLADLLERPIVAASRYEQKPASSPTLVSSVDSEQITALGYRSLGEALRSMRGVYLSNDRNYSYLGTRGFAVPGDYNTRFALSIEGHRINDPVYGQAAMGLELGLPLIAIDHVELLRGGAWSVYGQNALLGAIEVVTATGASRPGLEVRATSEATAETFGDPAGRPAIAPRAQDVSLSYGAVERGVDLFLAASYQVDPGLAAIYMPELASDELSCVGIDRRPKVCDGIVAGGDREEVGGAYLALRGKRFTLLTLASHRNRQTPTGAYGSLVGDPIETYDQRFYVDAGYKLRGARADLDARLALDHYDYAGTYPYDYPREGYPELPASRVVNRDFGGATWVTGELRGRYKWARLGRHITEAELAAGTEARVARGMQLSYDDYAEGETYIDTVGDTRMVAVTAHAKARVLDHVVGFAAARGDYYPDAFGLAVNPQLGLVLDLGEIGRLRATLARGIRAPNLYELHWNSASSLSTLEPEKSDTREVSLERYLGKHVRVLGVGYTQRITQLLALTTLDSGDQVFENRGTTRGYGLELEVEGRWDALLLRASYAYQHSHDEAEEHLVNSPRSLAVLTGFVPIGNKMLFAVETGYVGSRGTLAGPAIRPVFLTTTSLTVKDLAEDLDLSLGVRNLFDERTADPGSEEHVQSRIPGDPRTIWIRLTARVGGGRGGLLP